jgi:hypothetical protein
VERSAKFFSGDSSLVDMAYAGIEKNRDALLAKLKEMQAKKPKSDSENNLTTSISRVNASLAIAKDHLVSSMTLSDSKQSLTCTLCHTACNIPDS